MEPPKTALRRSSAVPLVLVGVVAAAGIAYAVLRLRGGEPAPPPAPTADAPAGAPAPTAPGDPAADAAPPPDAKDQRALLEGVSADPLYRRTLAGADDPVALAAVVIDNLAEGLSPRHALELLAPDRPFTVARAGERTVIDPSSYRRYDALADAVATVDAAAVARAYRALRRPLEAAYRTLAAPGASLDAALSRALQRLEAAPVVDGEVAVVDEGGLFLFEDARLERLLEVEKHLVRMGPRNARLVQEKARALRAALGLPAPAAAASPR